MLHTRLQRLLLHGIVLVSVALLYTQYVLGGEFHTEKAPYVKTCKIYQPGFTKCSTESIQKVITQLFSIGIPEVIAVFGSLDPMKVDKIPYRQNSNEVANIQADLTNVTVTGLSTLKIKESRVNKKDFSWDTKSLIPFMRLEGHYNMSGRILLLPLNGAGNFFIELDDMDINMHTTTRLYEKGGFTFYNVTDVRVFVTITGLRTNFENLFGGKSLEVERSTNEFFNTYWRDLYEALRPVIHKTVENIMIRILWKTFDVIPANFFVEDIPTPEQLYGKKT